MDHQRALGACTTGSGVNYAGIGEGGTGYGEIKGHYHRHAIVRIPDDVCSHRGLKFTGVQLDCQTKRL